MRICLLLMLGTFLIVNWVRAETAQGPRITDAEFFSMLDLDRPGLEKVKAAVGANDLDAARHELAEYLRHRDKPVWRVDWHARPVHGARPDGVNTRDADLVMQHNFLSVGVWHKFEGEIDWKLNPINYREWPWQLNRHHNRVTLARAYWDTGEEKYAKEFVFELLDWVRKCPVPLDNNGNSSEPWRTIEAGIRTGQTWMDVYHYFLSSPSFTDEAMVAMVKSFAEHAHHLMRWPTTGNWLTMECNGLLSVGVMFPEFTEAENWRKTATDRLYAELDRQVYPDGAQIELSTGYHQVSLSNFVWAWRTAQLNGYQMPADYVTKLKKMYDYNLRASMPGGVLPGLNDASNTNIKPALEEAFGFYPERKDFEWVATQGKKGEKPGFTSVAIPFAGHLVMRSGWEPNDLYLLLDAGPFGYGHQHEDALTMVLFAYGKYLLVDAGNYAYNSSEWRKYILSTRGHNTIMVDGEEQHRRGASREKYVLAKPLPNRWASSAGFDYASGAYKDGYGAKSEIQVTHTRSVFFVKPEYWIIVDLLTPKDEAPHRYESMFHLDVAGATVDDATKSVKTQDAQSANLAIVPLAYPDLTARIVSGQEKPTVQGWTPAGGITQYNMRPIPTALFERQVSGPASFLYALYPTAKDAKCPLISIENLALQCETGAQAIGTKIRFADGREDYFVLSGKRGSKIKFGDFDTDAEATYIRMEQGKVTRACLAGGTGLTRAGKRIPAETQVVGALSRTKQTHKF